VFGLAGAIALVSITLGALNYVLSQGDSSKLAKAKDTIMYSVIGLIVCLAAFSIVTFVIGKL
jgi:multisubunit Na+/H+ antiporter MnhB subunit